MHHARCFGTRLMTAAALLAACAGASPASQWAEPRGAVILPDATVVRVEIADTEAKRQRGLMFRERLGPDEGMIFLFDEPGFYPFWMKNTLIPLDMIWLDGQGRVVSIAGSVPPCKADPCPTFPPDPGTSALYVLEVQAGFARRHGVKVGDVLTLKGIRLKGIR
jgi:uncharacterized membrane protein (UPF0127 family)